MPNQVARQGAYLDQLPNGIHIKTAKNPDGSYTSVCVDQPQLTATHIKEEQSVRDLNKAMSAAFFENKFTSPELKNFPPVWKPKST